ncbi:MAG: (d)CMP kinase [Oscillospiraceae bacterium]|nr:(d)CMP kinase [Oscillospiraceae bacterium]
MEQKSIALDGPAGAGKSTLAKMVAQHFGLIYVDTGALYRCVGLYALRNDVHAQDEAAVTRLLPEINLEMKYDDAGVQRMFLGGQDVTDAIRTPEVSQYASDVSAMPAVRAFLLSMQREMAVKYDAIMDGRDIGTVVLPDAGLKIFITAEPKKRAYRRYLELLAKDPNTQLEDVAREMSLRDKNDSERAAAPLKAAGDAILLDTSNLNLEESFVALCQMISEFRSKQVT